jgi:thioredoxin-related protein
MKKLILICLFLISNRALSATSQIESIAGENLLTGQETLVSSKGKKGLVVVFMSAKCPCSDSHNAELRDLAVTFKEFSFAVVHSNADEGKDISQKYFEAAQFPFPVIEDKNTTIADNLKAFKTPHAYVFSTDGKTLYEGGMSNSKDLAKADRKYLREALGDLQAGRAVKTSEGRTLGCSIARGK